MNLTRIESRPTKGRLGQYCFSIDCEGHLADARVGDALAALHRVCGDVRYLGSYPRARRHPGRRADGPGRRRLRRRRRAGCSGSARPARAKPRSWQIRSAGQPTLHKIDGSEVQAGVGVVALGGDGVQVALAQQQEVVAGDLDLDAGRPG